MPKPQKMTKLDKLAEAEWEAKMDTINKTYRDNITRSEETIQRLKNECISRERELEDRKTSFRMAQANLYEASKMTKVTDDDFSTIQFKLRKLSGKLANFTPISKPLFIATKQEVVDYFQKKWPRDKDRIAELFNLMPDDKMDYSIFSLLVERLIIEFIVNNVFLKKIHLDDKINNSFTALEKLFAGHDNWVKDLRLKCSRATVLLIKSNDPSTMSTIDAALKELLDGLLEELRHLFRCDEVLIERVSKLIEVAVDISLPIRGQDDLIEMVDLQFNDPIHDHQVKQQHSLSGNADSIFMGISPVFLAKSLSDENDMFEDDEEKAGSYRKDCTLVFKGKAICN
ncbi:hypothetical protein BDB01DRAFT_775598 [Pilobolus umbonatus]|nr:hypothetical protein BDB01DRAFT_775598 [Pilobolus umbonatus]